MKNALRIVFRLVFVIGLIVCNLSLVYGQDGDPDDPPSFMDKIISWGGEDNILEVTVETDLRELIRNKFGETYQSAKLTMHSPEGEEMTFNVKVRPRGNIRREICFYPNLKYKFDKGEIEDAGMDKDYNNFKLVHKCKGGNVFDQYVIREYFTYRLANFVTPYSYRVKLLKVTYIDKGKKDKEHETYAYFIEDMEELAERFDGKELDRNRGGSHIFEREPMLKMSVFQYMIGNPDWAFGNMHNLDMIVVDGFPKPIPVAYDFDYSGLVNTTYSIPAASLPIENVTERIYRGPTCEEEEANKLMAEFKELEGPIMKYTEEFPHFEDRDRRIITRYLEQFFDLLEHPKQFQSEMTFRG